VQIIGSNGSIVISRVMGQILSSIANTNILNGLN
jgi:small neutral amino acid transporter SnatA (MarC family)